MTWVSKNSLSVFLIQISALENSWHLIYFIVVPEINDGYEKWVKLMEALSPVIPTHSSVYWVAQNDSHDTTSERFTVWETYSVKDKAFFHRVPTANIEDLSYFGKLMEDKWRRRADFRGSVITATTVVPSITIYFHHVRAYFIGLE